MSVVFTSITRVSGNQWLFSWSPSGNYRIVLNGVQIDTVTGGSSYQFGGTIYQKYPPPLEVVPTGFLALSEQYPSYLVMQWYAVAGAIKYNIREYVSGTWQSYGTVKDLGDNTPLYSFKTRGQLADLSTHQYEVTAVDFINQESVPRQFLIFVNTPPILIESSIKITYSKSNTAITVTAA